MSDDDMKRARAYDLLATRDGAIDVTFDDDVSALADALAAERAAGRAAGAREMRERAAAVARERARHPGMAGHEYALVACLTVAREIEALAHDASDTVGARAKFDAAVRVVEAARRARDASEPRIEHDPVLGRVSVSGGDEELAADEALADALDAWEALPLEPVKP